MAPSAQAETGGYQYSDATTVNQSNYDWGYASCKGYCSSYAYLNGVKYYTMSERGYAIRNCTDYVAWKLESQGVSNHVRGRGNGKDWDNSATGVSITATPEVGDAAVWNSGTYGHVAYVEEVRPKTGGGFEARVSEYNYAGTGLFTNNRWVSADSYVDFNGVGTPLGSTGGGGGAGATPAALMYVKTANTGNGNVEVHWVSSANSYSNWAGGAATPFGSGNAVNGTFTVHDMDGDGKSDLVYIKTSGTSSGKVEIHWANAADGFVASHSATTWFSTSDAANGRFMMGRLDGHPNLVFVKTANTGNGKVELHYVSSSVNNFGTWAGGTATWFSLSDAANGAFTIHDMDADSVGDLVFIKTANTTNGNVEIHWLNAATGFTQAPGSFITWFSAGNAANGKFVMANLTGGSPYLVFIKTASTGGSVEIHWATSANSYTTWDGGSPTWFNLNNVPSGSFLIGAE